MLVIAPFIDGAALMFLPTFVFFFLSSVIAFFLILWMVACFFTVQVAKKLSTHPTPTHIRTHTHTHTHTFL